MVEGKKDKPSNSGVDKGVLRLSQLSLFLRRALKHSASLLLKIKKLFGVLHKSSFLLLLTGIDHTELI